MRAVSLVPAATEMVASLGALDELVAVTHDCDYPAAVRSLPRVTRSTLEPHLSSREIDVRVRAAGERGESTFHLDADALRVARPDVILGQTLCAVCAVTLDRLPASLPSAPRVVPLEGQTLSGIFDDIARVAASLGRAERGAELLRSLRARLTAVEERVGGLPRPRVACLEWLDPLMNGGHWVPEQVALAGGIDVLGETGRRSREITFAELAVADADVIVVMPCGWDARRARIEAEAALAREPGWRELAAVRAERLHPVDGNAYFSRPGPRVVDGVELLAGLLHPVEADSPEPLKR